MRRSPSTAPHSISSPTSVPHGNLGIVHRYRGEFTEAIAEFRKARRSGTVSRFTREIERELTRTEHRAPLAPGFQAVLVGKLKPGDAEEMLGFAQLCHWKKFYGASARLWAEAFEAQPKLAEDMEARNRYNAACAAAMAGCGQGEDDPPLGEAAKARWRKQALDWLKADLAAWSKALEAGPAPGETDHCRDALQRWMRTPNSPACASLAALAKLPVDEQKACRAFWIEVDALLKKARDAKP